MPRPAERWIPAKSLRDWLAVLGSGLLLGSIICLMELMEQPLAHANLAAVWLFMFIKSGFWLGVGVVWAVFVRLAEPRLGVTALAALSLLMAVFLSLVLLAPVAMGRLPWFDSGGPATGATEVLPLDARLCHLLWTNGFYGGLFVTLFAAVRRTARSRQSLARMQQARDEAAALLEESRLEAFRQQLQPRVVIDVLAKLKALYRSDPPRADSLMDLLVGFLRPAARSLQHQAASFAAELDLAGRYLRLRSAMAGDPCLIMTDSAHPPDAPFPPRLLIPVVERFCLAGRGVSLAAGWRGGSYCADLQAERLAEGAIPTFLREDMTFSMTRGAWRLAGQFIPLGAGARWALTALPAGQTNDACDGSLR
jgi:hypothetical protein